MSRPRVLLGFFTVFAVLFGWLVVVDRDQDPERQAVEHLLDTYATAIREGRLDEARRRLTSTGYRERWSELLFQTGHMRAADELGPLQELRLTADALGHARDEDGSEVIRAAVLWEGRRSTATTIFDLVEEGGALRVHRTWSWPESGLGYERVW